MLRAYTLGEKAAKFGYRRYGLPGAIASGGAALAGYVVVKRALKSATNSESVTSAIDPVEIKNTVDEKGLTAVKDRETLTDAINEEELDTSVNMDEVQSSAEEESDKISDSQDGPDTNE